ncbi:MAG: hypothetical protein ACJ78Q_09870 [Chloroflexia bacterium]
MQRKTVLTACLTLAIMFAGVIFLGGQAAQAKQGNKPANAQKANKAKEASEAVVTATGKLVPQTVNGETQYILQDPSGKMLYYLEVGPRWYYSGTTYPLDKYANQQVTVTGVVDNPDNGKGPSPNANQKAKDNAKAKPAQPTDAPTLEVFTINNETLRSPGKPPWAGDPKNNPNHPGNKGQGHTKTNNGKHKGRQNKP